MDNQALLSELADLAEQLGVHVRRQPLGGTGGALAKLRGNWTLFIDTQCPAADQLETLGPPIGRLNGADAIYVSPALREYLDQPTR